MVCSANWINCVHVTSEMEINIIPVRSPNSQSASMVMTSVIKYARMSFSAWLRTAKVARNSTFSEQPRLTVCLSLTQRENVLDPAKSDDDGIFGFASSSFLFAAAT